MPKRNKSIERPKKLIIYVSPNMYSRLAVVAEEDRTTTRPNISGAARSMINSGLISRARDTGAPIRVPPGTKF